MLILAILLMALGIFTIFYLIGVGELVKSLWELFKFVGHIDEDEEGCLFRTIIQIGILIFVLITLFILCIILG